VALVTTLGQGIAFKKSITSDNEKKPNRVYFSKFQQYESVPIVNFLDIGAQDEPILRILALRDSLMVFKTDGLFRIGGENALSGFGWFLFDKNTTIYAPDTAVQLNNQIMALGEEGVVAVSDTGSQVISRPIEEVFNINTSSAYVNQARLAFGVGYESDRSYLLFVGSQRNSTIADVCYRYNFFTESWTSFPIEHTSGIIGEDDNR
jgi:hypothetical protein